MNEKKSELKLAAVAGGGVVGMVAVVLVALQGALQALVDGKVLVDGSTSAAVVGAVLAVLGAVVPMALAKISAAYSESRGKVKSSAALGESIAAHKASKPDKAS